MKELKDRYIRFDWAIKRTNDDLFFIVILFICLYFHKDSELNDYLCSYS